MMYLIALPIVILSLVIFTAVPALLRPLDPRRHLYDRAMHIWSRMTVRLFRIRLVVHGSQPPRGSTNYIYVANHGSYIDIPVIAAALDDFVAFVYKEELGRIPVWGWLLRLSPHVSISRSEGREALGTIEETGRAIREGMASVVIFPEGTRSTDGSLGEFRRGAFLLATRSGVPIVPVAVRGTAALLPRDDWRVRPGRVDVFIGQPIPVPIGVNRAEERAILEHTRRQLETMLSAG